MVLVRQCLNLTWYVGILHLNMLYICNWDSKLLYMRMQYAKEKRTLKRKDFRI